MRPVLAALAVTVLPTLAGARWFAGDGLVRYGLGGLVGVTGMGFGVLLTGLAQVPQAPLLGAALGLALVAAAGPRVRTRVVAPEDAGGAPRWVIVVVAGVGVVLVLLAFARPVAGYDGWAIWSLKAKDVAVTGSFDGPVFTDLAYVHTHPDYPPLLPAVQAVTYRLSGDTTVSWPLQVQLAWWWGAGALGLAGLVRRRGTVPLLLVVSWLLAPHLVRQAISGYADVPMALLLVAGASLLCAEDTPRAAWPGVLLLCGAALTKNEGLALALAVVVAVGVLHAARRRRALVAGAAVLAAYVPWGVFVAVRGLPNDVVAGLATEPPGTAEMAARLPVAALAIVRELVWVPRWGLLTIVCAAVLVLAGRGTRWRERGLLLAALAGLGLFLVTYVVTPRDFDFHVGGSVDRVVTAPLGLVALAAAAAGSPGMSRSQPQGTRRQTTGSSRAAPPGQG
jgi:MYXO-CTERM domain-containing protein